MDGDRTDADICFNRSYNGLRLVMLLRSAYRRRGPRRMPISVSPKSLLAAFDARWPGGRRRAGSIGLAVTLEVILLLVLLTLGSRSKVDPPRGETISTFDVREQSPRPEEVADQPPTAQADRPSPLTPPPKAVPSPSPLQMPPALVLPRPLTTPVPPAPAQPVPATPTTPKITAVMRSDMAAARGPQGSAGAPGDSQRIAGSGPNGEPLYRAQWYREPSPDELTGYLDDVAPPAWALINCQTQPQFRVDRCVLVDEYPQGANMGRSVLAAAWQFRIRPPRVGGKVLAAAWVRIRIDYTVRRAKLLTRDDLGPMRSRCGECSAPSHRTADCCPGPKLTVRVHRREICRGNANIVERGISPLQQVDSQDDVPWSIEPTDGIAPEKRVLDRIEETDVEEVDAEPEPRPRGARRIVARKPEDRCLPADRHVARRIDQDQCSRSSHSQELECANVECRQADRSANWIAVPAYPIPDEST